MPVLAAAALPPASPPHAAHRADALARLAWCRAGFIRPSVQRTFLEQGTGRHEPSDVVAKAKGELDALAAFLGDRPFFFGDAPTTIDATAWGFLSNMLLDSTWLEGCPIREHLLGLENLVKFVGRVDALVFAES